MIVLAVDSSAKTAGVALWRDGTVIYESYLATGLTHSETLLELVDAGLHACRLQPAQVEGYVVTAGPGSFTGLRIGLALVKGLAEAYDTPCVPVSTLEALAAACMVPGLVVPAMDARRGEVYTARFQFDGTQLMRLSEDTAVSAAQAVAGLQAGGPVTLMGDGAPLCAAAAEQGKLLMPPPKVRCQIAGALAALGAKELLAGRGMSAGDLRPEYHRLSQAERERAAKLEQSV